jgi:hypothetical protein
LIPKPGNQQTHHAYINKHICQIKYCKVNQPKIQEINDATVEKFVIDDATVEKSVNSIAHRST